MTDYNSQGIGNTAWSFAVLAFHDEPLLQALSAEALKRLSAFEVQNLANTAWACAKLSYLDAPLREALAAASLPRLS